MKAIVAALLALSLASCDQGAPEFQNRVAAWSHRLSELPAGSSPYQIQQWANLHKVHFVFLPDQRQFYANVERVPVNGLHFPCSEWSIIITVDMDPSGHSTKSKVNQVGTCL
ncbi:MAG TPA: hypothetical protein VFR91_00660 [Dyella sp.]|nr:hypothetical protein [Dyella sp.]